MSAAMPMPVSAMLMRTRFVPVAMHSKAIRPPSELYFTAFDSRFIKHCSNRWRSANTDIASILARSKSNEIARCAAKGAMRAIVSSANSPKCTGSTEIDSPPVSIRDMSSTSLIILSKCLPAS